MCRSSSTFFASAQPRSVSLVVSRPSLANSKCFGSNSNMLSTTRGIQPVSHQSPYANCAEARIWKVRNRLQRSSVPLVQRSLTHSGRLAANRSRFSADERETAATRARSKQETSTFHPSANMIAGFPLISAVACLCCAIFPALAT